MFPVNWLFIFCTYATYRLASDQTADFGWYHFFGTFAIDWQMLIFKYFHCDILSISIKKREKLYGDESPQEMDYFLIEPFVIFYYENLHVQRAALGSTDIRPSGRLRASTAGTRIFYWKIHLEIRIHVWSHANEICMAMKLNHLN